MKDRFSERPGIDLVREASDGQVPGKENTLAKDVASLFPNLVGGSDEEFRVQQLMKILVVHDQVVHVVATGHFVGSECHHIGNHILN